MAYVTWPADEKLNTDAPHDYWRRITDAIDPKVLERQVRWHALPVGWEQLDYPTFLERRRQLIARVVREAFETLTPERPAYTPSTPADMISAGESQTTEFKASAHWNVYTQQATSRYDTTSSKRYAASSTVRVETCSSASPTTRPSSASKMISQLWNPKPASTDTNSSSVNCSTATSPPGQLPPSASAFPRCPDG